MTATYATTAPRVTTPIGSLLTGGIVDGIRSGEPVHAGRTGRRRRASKISATSALSSV